MLNVGARWRLPVARLRRADREHQRLRGLALRILARRARAVGVLAAALILWVDPAPAQDARLRDLYSRAQAAQQSSDFQAAASHYEELVRLRPNLAEAHANLGSIYYQIREDGKAAAALERAIQLNPQLGAAPYFFLGVIASRQKNHEQAIRYLERSEKLDSSNMVIAYYLGEAYFANRQYSDAIPAFEKATSHGDFRADAYYYLSKAYGALSKRAMDRLAGEYPGSFYIHLARGRFHEGRRNWQEAERAYQAALKKNPGAIELEVRHRWVALNAASEGLTGPPPPLPGKGATMLGLLYRPPSEQEIDPLLREYRKRLQPGAPMRASAESLYRQAEEYQIASYLTARWISKNDPGSYRAHQLRAQLHESRGDTDDAVQEYYAALRLKPDLQNVRFAIASLLWSLSRFDEAQPELEAELRINPNHPEAHYVLGDILQVAGRNGEAKGHLLEALRLKPDLVEAHLAIERIHYAEGQFDKALDQMRTVVRLAPTNPTPHYRMSMLYRRLGKAEEARKALEAFQRLQDH